MVDGRFAVEVGGELDLGRIAAVAPQHGHHQVHLGGSRLGRLEQAAFEARHGGGELAVEDLEKHRHEGMAREVAVPAAGASTSWSKGSSLCSWASRKVLRTRSTASAKVGVAVEPHAQHQGVDEEADDRLRARCARGRRPPCRRPGRRGRRRPARLTKKAARQVTKALVPCFCENRLTLRHQVFGPGQVVESRRGRSARAAAGSRWPARWARMPASCRSARSRAALAPSAGRGSGAPARRRSRGTAAGARAAATAGRGGKAS